MGDCRSLLRLLLVAGVLMGSMDSTGAYIFYVGGRDGWVTNPSESYHDWAGRNRFQVNDTIVFKYKVEEDSVLVVNEQDFDACNASNPIERLEGGDSAFKFDRSGPFFFISGAPEGCKKGQKLAVVVMAVRQTPAISSPPPSSLPPSPSPASGGRRATPVSAPSTAPAAAVPPTSSDGGIPPAAAPSGPISSSPDSNPPKLSLGMMVLTVLGGVFLA